MRAPLIAALLAASSAVSAQPLIISNDQGGVVDKFVARYHRIERNRTPVHIRGECTSACTLVMMLPRWEVCIEPKGTLGFHLFSRGDVAVPDVTQHYFDRYYRPEALAWLKKQAPLTTEVIYMTAAEAVQWRVMPACK